MFGRAQLLIGERSGLFLPKATVHERGQLTFVFVADDGQARMRLVKTGKEYLDLVEVLSGFDRVKRSSLARKGNSQTDEGSVCRRDLPNESVRAQNRTPTGG